jgi:hypothetical protein
LPAPFARFSRLLLGCAELGEEVLQTSVAAAGREAIRSDFTRSLATAAAALRAAAVETELPDGEPAGAFARARDRCREAAIAARAAGLDVDTLRCAAACERAALLCERALAEVAYDAAVDERVRRIEMNEKVFREINERVRKISDTFGAGESELEILCECGDRSCTDTLELPLSEYQAVRADRQLFVVKPGHELEFAEHVVEERGGHVIVRKPQA